MKRLFLAVALCGSTIAAMAQATAPQSLAIGSDIPVATQQMVGMDNVQETLGARKTDKGLLVMFSCNTCPFVVKAEARTQEAIKAARAAGVGMVIINSNVAQRDGVDSKKAMVDYGKAKYGSIPYVIDADAKVADAFGATRTPEVFLFNGEGKLVYKGAMEDNPGEPATSTKIYIVSAIKNMVTGQPITPPSTKSVGCSIKR